MPVLASPDVIEQILDDLRTNRERMQDVQAEISARAHKLRWEGGGVDRFHTQLEHANKGFNHCADVFEQVVRLLGRAATELTQARGALVRAENFVMNEAMKQARNPGAFFHRLGWTQYPVLPDRFSTEWEDLAIRAGYRR